MRARPIAIAFTAAALGAAVGFWAGRRGETPGAGDGPGVPALRAEVDQLRSELAQLRSALAAAAGGGQGGDRPDR